MRLEALTASNAPQRRRLALPQATCRRSLCARFLLCSGGTGDRSRWRGAFTWQPADAGRGRDRWLAAQGTQVLRYSASDVLSNLEGVVREVMKIALERRDRAGPDRCPPPPPGCAWHLPLAGEE